MAGLKKIPSPITILIIVIIIAAAATWILPAGEYDSLNYANNTFTLTTAQGSKAVPLKQHTLDSLKISIPLEKFKSGDIFKPVAVPRTYHRLKNEEQGFTAIAQAPIKGIYDAVELIFFILFIGGFISVFQQTGAMEQGLTYLSYRMKGKEAWLIVIITFFFAFCGSANGMSEESLAFYPIIVPLFLAAGYDLLVPVAVIFAGTCIGHISSFCNPFSTIIASNSAGINWTDGLSGRIVMFVIITSITIWYIVRYAQKIKKNPATSLVQRFDGEVKPPFPAFENTNEKVKLELKNGMLLLVFLATIVIMIFGFASGWAMPAITSVFLLASILIAIITRMREKLLIEKFIEGIKSLLSVAIIIGFAHGVTIILKDGHISGTILNYAAGMEGQMHPVGFILIILVLYMVLTLFISSSSGMAALTMPVFGSLAVIIGVPGKEIVNAYIFGMGIMGLVTPTGLVLPSLAIANVSVKAWWRFIYPLIIILFVVCAVALVVGVEWR
jgi:uncharacterized ion transporter superfamily protein YfcC